VCIFSKENHNLGITERELEKRRSFFSNLSSNFMPNNRASFCVLALAFRNKIGEHQESFFNQKRKFFSWGGLTKFWRKI